MGLVGLRWMERSLLMRIELRVDRNGQRFLSECDTQRGSSFAEFFKSALKELY